jgi:hypothetical protein
MQTLRWWLRIVEIGAIGVALVVASRTPEQAKVLVWTIIAIELARGIANDVYMIARGYNATVFVIWIVIHTVVILTGLRALGWTGLIARGSDRGVVLQRPATE